GKGVGAGGEGRRERGDARPGPGEGAGVEVDPPLARRDATAARHAGLDLDDRALARIRRRELFLAGRDHLDGAAALLREQRGHVLDAHPQLAAEAAADTGND